MHEEHKEHKEEKNEKSPAKKDNSYLLPASIVASALIVAGGWMFSSNPNAQKTASNKALTASVEKTILPPEGVVLPARWGDLGAKLVSSGVIDKEKLEEIYAARGGLSDSEKAFLEKSDNGNLKMTPENADYLLNLLWALGLGNKNDILEKGPMMTYSGAGSPAEALAQAGRFASTGGWTIAKGDAMNHYSRYRFVALTTEQQQLVEKVSKNIYRPCCGNSVYFPDCNHGMAMLGLLELMASQGVGEEEMYAIALKVNSYWFPDTYLTIAKYLEVTGSSWNKTSPQTILGADFSSAAGYQRILEKVTPPESRSGGGCGV